MEDERTESINTNDKMKQRQTCFLIAWNWVNWCQTRSNTTISCHLSFRSFKYNAVSFQKTRWNSSTFPTLEQLVVLLQFFNTYTRLCLNHCYLYTHHEDKTWDNGHNHVQHSLAETEYVKSLTILSIPFGPRLVRMASATAVKKKSCLSVTGTRDITET